MKKLLMKLPKWLRATLLTALSLGLTGGIIAGVLFLIRGNASVKVFYLEDIGQYSSSGNAQTDGSVTTDRVQSVYVSSTQEVKEILVEEGQEVHAGDELLTFDTTLTDLSLERKDIAVRQLELDLSEAQKKRQAINYYNVYDPNAQKKEEEEEEEDPELEPGEVGLPRKGLGTEDNPLVFLWNEECKLDNAFLEKLMSDAKESEMSELFCVFEQREQDSLQGKVLSAWEICVNAEPENQWSFVYVTLSYDPSVPSEEGGEEKPKEEEPTGPSYTWAEIVALKKDADEVIRNLEIQLEMAKLELETVRHELESGTVKATIDGVVKTVRSVDEARMDGSPVILVSGGGGYLVTGAMSEIELAAMHVGDSVSVLSWENYETVEGVITSISEFPDETGRYYHYSEGNQNVSLYPFTVSIGEDANLREGEYVQLTYCPGGAGSGYFLMNCFLRNENGQSYIWGLGEKGLEKRYVSTGGSLWSSYTQITGGMEGIEYLAFPYGNLRSGQKTETAGIETLYGY